MTSLPHPCDRRIANERCGFCQPVRNASTSATASLAASHPRSSLSRSHARRLALLSFSSPRLCSCAVTASPSSSYRHSTDGAPVDPTTQRKERVASSCRHPLLPSHLQATTSTSVFLSLSSVSCRSSLGTMGIGVLGLPTGGSGHRESPVGCGHGSPRC